MMRSNHCRSGSPGLQETTSDPGGRTSVILVAAVLTLTVDSLAHVPGEVQGAPDAFVAPECGVEARERLSPINALVAVGE
eukprot:4662113-Heterocapsa_arctica.AAC.1